MFSPHKNKTKFFSLLSSLILWIYVTNVVDPTESKTFKGIPITINLSNVIHEYGLNVFPEENLTADITLKTNLSKLKKISKDNLTIHGNISNPTPGKNILTLSSNLPNDIHHEIEASDLIVNLEFYETIEKDISIIANKKYTSDEYEINIDSETVEVSGTKTILNKIDKIVATLTGNDTEGSFNEKLEVIPLDIDGNKIENLKLSNKYINADIIKIEKEEELNNDNTLDKKDNNSKNKEEKNTNNTDK